jgi:hypothetical protein
MNLASYLAHWNLIENPFRAEEARHDPVFSRLGSGPTVHPDFEKILGDLSRPGSAIVFGEKGSGKTAIRLQLEQRVAAHNKATESRRVFLLPYDDLNPVIDRVCAAEGVAAADSDRDVLGALKNIRLTDHLDGILCAAVSRVVDALLTPAGGDATPLLGESPAKRLRGTPIGTRRDMVILQTIYDRDAEAPDRTRRLRRALGVRTGPGPLLIGIAAALGWVIPLAVFAAWFLTQDESIPVWLWQGALATLSLAWLILAAWHFLAVPWGRTRRARRIAKSVRAAGRTAPSLAGSLAHLTPEERRLFAAGVGSPEERRYEALDRLTRILAPLGFVGAMIVVDRVDEPSLVNGQVDRMRAVVWPMLSNTFLQHAGIGVKLLLPIELRHELFRESTAFFQEARLDKQSMVERLAWTGAVLYDLCTARLTACRTPGSAILPLIDLFEDDVTRQDIVDALEQMHQPRDAFKFLYQCIQEHCAGVTEDQAKWRIPRIILEMVKRQQSERVQMLYRGVRPA